MVKSFPPKNFLRQSHYELVKVQMLAQTVEKPL